MFQLLIIFGECIDVITFYVADRNSCLFIIFTVFVMVVMFFGTALGLYYYSNVCDAVVMHSNGVWGCSNYIIFRDNQLVL
jgi:hypothetical protein